MTNHLLRAGALSCALLASTALTTVLPAPAMAQSAPAPVRQSIDANGVDLFAGTFNVDGPGLSFGQGDNGLDYRRLNRGLGWTDNVTATLYPDSGSLVRVSLGGRSDSFTVSGSTYTATEGNGATLTFDSGTNVYTYTRADGTVAHFDKTRSHGYPYYSALGRATDITFPSGQTLTYDYHSVTYCSSTKPGGAEGLICIGHDTVYRLASVRNSFGYRVSLDYPEMDPIDPDDPFVTFDFNTFSNVLGVTGTNLAVASGSTPTQSFGYTYTSGVPTAYGITDAAGRTTQYRLSSGKLAGITFPGSGSEDVTITYSGTRVASIANARGTTTYASSDASGVRTVTVTDALSHATTYTFDIASQRMTSMTDATSQTTSWQYDGSGRVTKITQPEGNYVEYTYDGRGNVTQVLRRDKAGNSANDIVTTAAYPSTCANPVTCNQPTSTTDANGNVTDYTYDSTHGGVLTVTLPAPSGSGTRPQVRYGYTQLQAYFKNSGGSIVASGEPVYRQTSTSTCQTGSSPTCVGTADEVVTSVSYGPQTTGTGNNLLPVSTSAGAGDSSLTATSTMTYDDIGNLLTVDGPLSGSADTVRNRYDAARQRIGTVGPDPDGGGALHHRAQRVTYNDLGQPTTVERGTVDSQSDGDWAGFTALESVQTEYDSLHRPVVQRLESAAGTTYALTQTSYDGAGRVQCVAQRMNTAEFASLSLPSDACTLDTQGSFGPDRIVRTSYDDANRPTLVETGVGTGDEADEVAASYTDNGQTETVTDAEGNRTTYVYDGHDRLSRTQMPDPATPGTSSTTDYEELTYDDNGNVTNRRLRDGTSIAFTYDNLNRLTGYDIPNVAAWDTDLAFGYDLLGRRTSASDSNGHGYTFAYDALGRLLSETSNWYGVLASSQYDLAGRRTRLTHRDGFYVDYDYDETGAMVAVRENGASSGAGVLATYAYDDLGRRVSLTRGNGTVTSYGYDAVSRLDELTQDFAGTGDDVTTTFGHDPAGGIASLTRSNDAFAFAHANASVTDTHNGLNQIVTTGATNVSHDARGNTSAIGANAYTYAADNRLLTAPATTFAYDPLGRLFGESGEWRLFHYDGARQILETQLTTDTILRRYVHGAGVDEPLVWYEGSGTTDRRWLHADERGSIVAVSDGSGNVTQVNSYDEYGVPAPGNAGRFGYTGQAWLPQAGMWYYKARMYNPSLPRFMQADPVGYWSGMNVYNYTGGDPVNFTDPSGLSTTDCTLAQNTNLPECDITITGYPGGLRSGEVVGTGGPLRFWDGGFGSAGGGNGPAPRDGFRCYQPAVDLGVRLKRSAENANTLGRGAGLAAGAALLIPGAEGAAPPLGGLSAISLAVGGVQDIVGSTIIAVETQNYRGYVYDVIASFLGQVLGTGNTGADAASGMIIDTMSRTAQGDNSNPRCPNE